MKSSDFTGFNVCRFCLTENDPKEMMHIPWNEWENDPLAKLYKIVTNRNVSRIIANNLYINFMSMIKSRNYFSALHSVTLFRTVLPGMLQHDISAEYCIRTLPKG